MSDSPHLVGNYSSQAGSIYPTEKEDEEGEFTNDLLSKRIINQLTWNGPCKLSKLN
jgi:hypothetical protein